MTDQALSQQDREALLQIARSTIEECVGVTPNVVSDAKKDKPTLNAGAFVSLHRHGQLRGCIGTFETDSPVVGQVREMAVAAATRDPRFRPLTREELEGLDIEISVLTPPRLISDVAEIEVGQHGLVISRGYRRGVLLPQVATDHGWDRETFLRHTCVKAGLPQDSWQKPDTKIEVFSAEVFGER